jgi:hypothetical protein
MSGECLVAPNDDYITPEQLRALKPTDGWRVVHETELVPAPFTIRQLRSGWELVPHGSRAVLDAWQAASTEELEWMQRNIVNMRWLARAATAELARRASQVGDQIAPDSHEPAENTGNTR